MRKVKRKRNNLLSLANALLFGSGACALIYQITWFREFRLVFGSSTMATTVVLAIFMGGMGVGAVILGRFADRHQQPLLLYGWLELLVGVSAALTPLWIDLIRFLYIAMGGSLAMGPLWAPIVRVILSSFVLGSTVFLVGGTLPAIARAVVTDADVGRRDLALLYGVNALGAVFGTVLSSFVMLELLGTRLTLWTACGFNGLIGLLALWAGWRRYGTVVFRLRGRHRFPEPKAPALVVLPKEPAALPTVAPNHIVYLSAFVLGFVFFLMELVWYRMLAPILGGSTYTFGIIIAVALFGLGCGGVFFGVRKRSVRTSLFVLSVTCGLEACALAMPFALGDQLAILAALSRSLGSLGFYGHVYSWFVICSIIVLPGALVAGFQFPVLIGLRGRGQENVGKHTGMVYGWNTAGAIIGALAGGLVLIPGLSALGSWQLATGLLCIMGLALAFYSHRFEGRRWALTLPVLVAMLAMFHNSMEGPTAVWRHSAIGAGRADLEHFSRNELRDWMHERKRNLLWETDGVESSLGLDISSAISFVLNGKIDGNVSLDSATQVMAPLVGAILHPNPQKALVIGLGTGCSAGWLADIDSVQQVDVIEMETDILSVADESALVNRTVMSHPGVNIIIGDAREILLTSREKYDLIFSEPSNPYRVGVSSLYTREFYEAAAGRLMEGGIFSQWIQAYEVDSQTVKIIYATLSTVFPFVQTWETTTHDLLLVCSLEEIKFPMQRLRSKILTQPYRDALLYTWGATDLEGFMARFIADPALTKIVAKQEVQEGRINTDDRMLVEFGFAKTVGKESKFSINDLRELSRKLEIGLPVSGGEIDRTRVDDNYSVLHLLENLEVPEQSGVSNQHALRTKAFNAYLRTNYQEVLASWQAQPREPEYPMELAVLAEAYAEKGDPSCLPLIARLRACCPTEAAAIMSKYNWEIGDHEKAMKELEFAFIRFRTDPWPQLSLMRHFLLESLEMAEDPALVGRLYELYSKPFAVHALHNYRMLVLLELARRIGVEQGVWVLEQMEPYVPWNEETLHFRQQCYSKVNHPLAAIAKRELAEYLRDTPVSPFDGCQ